MTKNAFHWQDHDVSPEHVALLKRTAATSKRATGIVERKRAGGTNFGGIYGISRASDDRIRLFKTPARRGK